MRVTGVWKFRTGHNAIKLGADILGSGWLPHNLLGPIYASLRGALHCDFIPR